MDRVDADWLRDYVARLERNLHRAHDRINDLERENINLRDVIAQMERDTGALSRTMHLERLTRNELRADPGQLSIEDET